VEQLLLMPLQTRHDHHSRAINTSFKAK